MAIQDDWDRILEQGYVDFQGFHPDQGYQRDTYRAGLADLGGRRTRALGTGRDTGTWRVNIENRQDLLDYLEWAGSLGVHNRQRRGKLGIGQADYTGQDVYDYFVRPGERQSFEDERMASQRAWKGAQAVGSALASQYGSRLGLGGGTQGEYLRQAGQAVGGAQAEEALVGGLARYAEETVADPTRLRDIEQISQAFGRGHGEQGAKAEEVATGAEMAGNIGMMAGMASMNPYGAAAGAAVKLGSMVPELIAADQARRHRGTLARRQTALEDVSPANWQTQQAGLLRGSQAIAPTRFGGSAEGALRNIYQDDEEENRFRSTFT